MALASNTASSGQANTHIVVVLITYSNKFERVNSFCRHPIKSIRRQSEMPPVVPPVTNSSCMPCLAGLLECERTIVLQATQTAIQLIGVLSTLVRTFVPLISFRQDTREKDPRSGCFLPSASFHRLPRIGSSQGPNIKNTYSCSVLEHAPTSRIAIYDPDFLARLS